jgi:CDP-glucose 4,6-dehydratase
VEGVVSANHDFWRGRSVLLTGHTGFKGGWLALWLSRLGAVVHGYALEPPTDPSMFAAARVGRVCASDTRADLADLEQLKTVLGNAQPEVVLHLAAQALVREGYRDPVGTLQTNVMGAAHVLEAVRSTPSVRAVVVVTTDKVYENRETPQPYREVDRLGGRDPYGAGKAAAEIVTAAYRSSFFSSETGHPAHVATARAGNVIGGGDWATDRLVPDCLRAFETGAPVRLRSPHAVRPWQHVLEPLSGYLRLAERLLGSQGASFARPWNFGPHADGDATVGEVAQDLARLWGDSATVEVRTPDVAAPEAGLLSLDSAQACAELGWEPRWSLQEALERTVAWHRAWGKGADVTSVSLSDIDAYEAARPR